MKNLRWAALPTLVALIALSGCSPSPTKPQAAEPAKATESPSAQASTQLEQTVVDGRLPEEDLAIIDRTPGLAKQYANLLDEIEPKCNESRRKLADMTVGTVKMTTSKGVKTNNLDMLSGLRNSLEPYKAGNKQDCAYVYAVLHTIVTQGK